MTSLPDGWIECPVGRLGKALGGLAFRPQDAKEEPAPDLIACFRTSNIQQRLDQRDVLFIPRILVRNEEQLLQEGDILISTANSDALVGKCVIVEGLQYPATLGGFISAFRVDPKYLNPRFLFFWLSSPLTQARMRSLARKTTNIANLAMSDVAKAKIPLPPLSEQQRIVDILQEAEEIRRLRSQAEAKTAELIPALFHEMFGDPVSNPKKWSKAPLGELINGTPKNGLYKPADLYGEGTPIIRIGDFTGGILRDAKALQRVRISDEEASQFGVANGQIVINRVNSIEHLGKSLLLAGLTEPTVYESNMMRLDPKLDEVLPDYLIACLHHGSILSKLRAKAKKAINQASINQTDVVTLEIPVPSLEAQHKFAAQVRAVDHILNDEGQTLRRGHLLEKSISAHAFTGQLTAEWRSAQDQRSSIDEFLAKITNEYRVVPFVGAGISRPLSTAYQALVKTKHLTRDQLKLATEILELAHNREISRYFTAELLSDRIKGPLHRHPQAIESHLTVFAVRGIVIPVSRARDAVPGKPFAASYRLPMNEEGAAPEQRDDVKAERMKHQRTAPLANAELPPTMRLRYLYLPDYGPLKEVAVVFEKNPHIDNRQGAVNFVVGLNGSGKSSLLRAIYDVFHSLSREELPKFPVTLIYDHKITPWIGNQETGERVPVQETEDQKRKPLYNTMVFHRPRGSAERSFLVPDYYPRQPDTAEGWQSHVEQDLAPICKPEYRGNYVTGDRLKGDGNLRHWLPTRVLAYTSGDLDPWQAMAYPIAPSDELPDPGSEIDRSTERPHGWDRRNESRREDQQDVGDGPEIVSGDESEEHSKSDRCFLLRPEDARLAAAAVGIWQAAQELQQHRDEAQLAAFREALIAHLNAPNPPPVEGARRLLNELDWLQPTHAAFRFSRDTDHIPHPDHARLFWLFALAENVVAQPLGESLAVVSLGHGPEVRPEDLTGNEDLEPALKDAGEPMRNARCGAEALRALLSGGKTAEESLWSIFQTLRSWRSHGLLTDVQLTVKRIRQVKAADGEPDDRILSYASFSDGEQMLLGRMAFLLLLRKQDNSLLLLDEPETHFNDAWKRQIIDMVDDSILKDTSAHVLVSTHTSLALTDVFSCEITRLVKDQGTTRAERVAHPTFGADPGRILLHIFGAPDVIGARAAEFLREKLRKVEWSHDEREKLRALVDEIGSGWPRAKLMELLDELDGTQPEDLPHVAFDS